MDKRKPPTPGGCIWREDACYSGMWNTSCGQCFMFEAGSPQDNYTRFCPSCGARCKQEGPERRRVMGKGRVPTYRQWVRCIHAAESNPQRQGMAVDLITEIRRAINRTNAEAGSDTPDFVLAEFLIACLAAFDTATASRGRWYGCHQRPGDALQAAPGPQRKGGE